MNNECFERAPNLGRSTVSIRTSTVTGRIASESQRAIVVLPPIASEEQGGGGRRRDHRGLAITPVRQQRRGGWMRGSQEE